MSGETAPATTATAAAAASAGERAEDSPAPAPQSSAAAPLKSSADNDGKEATAAAAPVLAGKAAKEEEEEDGGDDDNNVSSSASASSSSSKEDDGDDEDDSSDDDDKSETTSPVENNAEEVKRAPITTVDLNRLSADGLITAEEKQRYLDLRKPIDAAQNLKRFDGRIKQIILSTFEELNPFCIYLLVPETYSKTMKETIQNDRSLIKILCQNPEDVSSLSSTESKLYNESLEAIKRNCCEVVKTCDKLLVRILDKYKVISEELFPIYESRLCMVKSSILKIKADFMRYLAEALGQEAGKEYAEISLKEYREAIEGFASLPGGIKNHYYLSSKLNYSVLLCDVFKDVSQALTEATGVLNEMKSTLSKSDISDATLVGLLQLFKENIAIWTESLDAKATNKVKDGQAENDTSLPPAQPQVRKAKTISHGSSRR